MCSYNSIVRSAFTVFDCTNVQLPTGSVSVVTSLPAIECGSGEHTTLFLLHSFFGLIIAFGFPLALFLMYRRHYHGKYVQSPMPSGCSCFLPHARINGLDAPAKRINLKNVLEIHLTNTSVSFSSKHFMLLKS